MKCVHCRHDAKYKDRSDGRCPTCKKRFAFEPKRGDPMTDGVFAAAIERVSSGDRVRFTADNVYYEIRRRYRRTLRGHVIGAAATTAIFAGFFSIAARAVFETWVASFAVLGISGLAFGVGFFDSSGVRDRRRFPRAKFDAMFRRYTDAHGTPKTFIERKEPSYRRAAAQVASSEEMLSYSFDRAVICDRPETVDLLLANNFHFENNCAVLGIGGYPEHAFETVRKMLRNNPKLLVIALHDASIEGCKLADRLRNDSAWFKDGAQVVDVGLRPVHRKSFPGQEDLLEPTRAVPPGEGISGAEAKWLSHSALALAVVTPEQIIKRLFRSMTLVDSKQDDSGGGGGDSGGGSPINGDFGDDADASDGGDDSFG